MASTRDASERESANIHNVDDDDLAAPGTRTTFHSEPFVALRHAGIVHNSYGVLFM